MNVDQCTNLSLCSGGGGLDLGLELALGSLRTVCWVEWEAFAIEYLAAAMEAGCLVQAPVSTDLRTFDGRPWRGVVDTLTAGYPCQPFSVAGKRRGEGDPRHLWPHVCRVIGEVQPAIVFLENVPGHLSLGFEKVACDLQAMGYEVATGLFTAEEIGASHRRERLFIVAQSNESTARSGCQQTGNKERRSGKRRESTPLLQRTASDGGLAATNGHLPQIAMGNPKSGRKVSMQQSGQPCGAEPTSAAMADAQCSERRKNRVRGTHADGQDSQRTQGAKTPGSNSGALAVTQCQGLSSTRKTPKRPTGPIDTPGASPKREFLPLFPPGPGEIEAWRETLAIDPTFEPAICGLVDGLASHRLRLLGNGVVPLQAAYAFVSLWSALNHKGAA